MSPLKVFEYVIAVIGGLGAGVAICIALWTLALKFVEDMT